MLPPAPMSIQVGEIYSAADHAEIVVVSEIPTEIGHPADVPRNAHFESATNLAECSRVVIIVPAKKFAGCLLDQSLALRENRAAASVNIRREARATDWVAQSERSLERANDVIGVAKAHSHLAGRQILAVRL